VTRSTGATDVPKDSAWQDIVAPHSVQQAGGAQPTRDPATKRGENQDETHCIEQEHAANALTDVHKRGHEIRKGVPVRPDPLAKVNLKTTENSGEHANQDRGQEHIAFWIFNLFRKGRDSIKANVGECGERGCRPDPASASPAP